MTGNVLTQVLLSLAVIIAIARAGGALFERFRQPAVVGEIVAGIAAGPSVLGLIAPGLSAAIAPAEVRPYLQVVAQLGLVVFMLVVGLEIETLSVGRRARTIGAVSAGAAVLPFGLGILLAIALWPSYRTTAGLLPFVLFLGVVMAVTAFPVLARIIHDRGMSGTAVGAIALACAAVMDVAAWSVLAVVVSLVAPGGGQSWSALPAVVAFVAVMLLVVRPLLANAQRRGVLDRISPRTVLVAVLVAAVLAACFTETIGLHSIFGPFVLGVALPRHEPTVKLLTTRLADTSSGLLLPAFFVVAGMSVDVRALSVRDLGVLGVTLLVAVGGKVIGAAVPAQLVGLSRHDALTLGVLLNTRGLTELVVLSVGLSVGLLTPPLYTILVITAVLTTVATGPLLELIGRRRALVPAFSKGHS